MLKVGLTGGIGSGKSTASKYFEKLGAFIFDADTKAKNLISTNDLVQHELITEFGTDIIDISGQIDKKKLSRIAFQDVDHQRQLNSVVHPYVFDLLDKSFDKKLIEGNHDIFVIDGAINHEPFGEYQTIHPDEIAKTYLQFHQQDKSAWAWEIELRTSVEKF